MDTKKNKSAFPIVESKYNGIVAGTEQICTDPGMSKLLFVSTQAMNGLISVGYTGAESIAVESVKIAKCLIEEVNKYE